mmetsp:Transcript_30646/g.42436  ORF Transcript_30646/g.42436 Transcript_30646/m.42436 type:complete len:306 (-) Transcript_30646:1154-2071(-)
MAQRVVVARLFQRLVGDPSPLACNEGQYPGILVGWVGHQSGSHLLALLEIRAHSTCIEEPGLNIVAPRCGEVGSFGALHSNFHCPADDVQEEVCRVLNLGSEVSHGLKVLLRLICWAKVRRKSSRVHQHNVMEQHESQEAGLVHDRDDRPLGVRELVEALHYAESVRCRQPGGGFVKEQRSRIRNQLQPNADQFALASRDAPFFRTAHHAVLHEPQVKHLLQHPSHNLQAPRNRVAAREPKVGTVVKILVDGHVCEDGVILRHKAQNGLNLARATLHSIGEQLSRQFSRRTTPTQCVQQGCLSAT